MKITRFRPKADSTNTSELLRVKAPERLVAGLATVAGFVGAYGFIKYRTCLSFMSRNTALTGSLIGQGNFAAAVPALLSVLSFLAGVFVGTYLIRSGARQFRWLLFGVAATLLAVIMVVTPYGSPASWVSIAMLSLAMGLMNTAPAFVILFHRQFLPVSRF